MIAWMAWRLHRKGLIGFGLGGFLISVFYGGAFQSAAGSTPEAQAAFGRSVMLVARQFAFIIPIPVHPETLGGYEQYKWLSGAVVMMMLWAGLAGIAVGRGEESRGLTEQWLGGGISRAKLLLSRSGAFLAVLALACFASTLGISAIAPAVHQDANLAGEIGKAVSMVAGLFACYGLALVISQLPAERGTASALGIGVLVLLFIVNGIADTVDSAAGSGVISPFHWMEKTSSAAPGGVFDLAATAGLAVAGLVFLGLSVLIFQRRDIGAGLLSWRLRPAPVLRTPSHNPLLRLPFAEGLWEQRVGLAAWANGTLFLGAAMVSVTRSMVDALITDPNLKAVFQKVFSGDVYPSMLGFIWFGLALLILSGYSVVQVSRWAAQDQEGRVEMLLSWPVSRTRVVVERALEFALASLAIVVAGYLGVAAELPKAGISVDGTRLLGASFMLWPFALAFGGVGVAVVSRWPRIAVPFLAAFAVVEYFLGDLAPLFKFPDWIANLSFFHLFGNPLTGNPPVTPGLVMVVVFLAGFAAALFLMRQRDLAGTA